jgi:pyridoxal phosphate enzyme (YggS family)
MISDIATQISEITKELPSNSRLIAVSKFHPEKAIIEAYDAGQRLFGENHVQEMTEKYEHLPKDIEWHFLGHLQSNKIKYIVPYVAMIHSIDSYKLLVEINKQAVKAGRIINCLLQLHIAKEITKFGFSFDECRSMLDAGEWRNLSNIHLSGVMGMATNTNDTVQVALEFQSLKVFFNELKSKYFTSDNSFKEISMGMTHDYSIALQNGSTLVRIGTKIFGERDYSKSK